VKKRKPAAAGAEKAPRAAAAGGELDMAAHVRANTLEKLTVDVLKGWLKERGIPVSNKKKAQLVQDVLGQF
jgi:hypothetical protein